MFILFCKFVFSFRYFDLYLKTGLIIRKWCLLVIGLVEICQTGALIIFGRFNGSDFF